MQIKDRLKKLRHKIEEYGLEAILISQAENRYYLSGFHGSAGYLLITTETATLATDFRYVEQAKEQAPEYYLFQITNNLQEWFPRLLNRFNIHHLGFEASHITYSIYQQMITTINDLAVDLRLIPLNNFVESLRMVKTSDEITLISTAAEISDQALNYIQDNIYPQATELEIAWMIEKYLHDHGSEAVPFELIVASGPNAALPHARPSQRRLQPGEPLVIDIGAKVEGYSSDITRTLCVGDPDKTYRHVYNIVLTAQQAAIDGINEGMTGEEADNIARMVIERAGYGDVFGHGLGHGIGLATHELPRLGPQSKDKLLNGTVFSIEPGIYLPGWGGVRIEDLIVIDNNKLRILSKARK